MLENVNLNKFYVLKNSTSDAPQNWSLANGYVNDKVKLPPRAFDSDRYAFHLIFDDEDKSNICFKYKGTYRIMLHLPNEVPMWDFSLRNELEIGYLRTLEIGAKLKTTNENLRGYTPEQRRCYFEGKFNNIKIRFRVLFGSMTLNKIFRDLTLISNLIKISKMFFSSIR